MTLYFMYIAYLYHLIQILKNAVFRFFDGMTFLEQRCHRVTTIPLIEMAKTIGKSMAVLLFFCKVPKYR